MARIISFLLTTALTVIVIFTSLPLGIKIILTMGVTYSILGAANNRLSNIANNPFHPHVVYKVLTLITFYIPIIISPSSINYYSDKSVYLALLSSISFLIIIDFVFAIYRSGKRPLYPQEAPPSVPDGRGRNSLQVTRILMFVLIAIGWAWRAYNLSRGNLAGTFLGTQVEVNNSTNTTGVLNNFGLLGLCGLLALCGYNLKSNLVKVLIIGEIVWSLISGSKIAVLYVLVPLLLVLVQYKKVRFSVWGIVGALGALALVVISFSLVGNYRAVVQGSVANGQFERLSYSTLNSTLSGNTAVSQDEIIERLNWFGNFALLLDKGENGIYNSLYGSSYLPIFYWYVPRFIWEEKPNVSLGEWYGREVLGWAYGTRSEGAITIWGDGYLNFGITGIVIAELLWALVIFKVYDTSLCVGPWGVFFLSTVYMRMLLGMEQNAAAPLVAIQQSLLLVFFVYLLNLTLVRILAPRR